LVIPEPMLPRPIKPTVAFSFVNIDCFLFL
jgi:hypothetical protein